MNIIYTAPTWAVVVAGILAALVVAGVATWRWFSDELDEMIIMGSFAFLMIASLTVGIPMAMRESADYATWCQAQGGHVDSSTQLGTTTTDAGNGQVGVGTTTTTTTYCLSEDGRILDVS